MTRRLVLFTGMGADGRLLEPIHVSAAEVLTPDHLEPHPGESLPDYARRVAAAHHIRESDVIGGASFGGMLAAEISRQIPVAGLILLGSSVRPSAFPVTFRLLDRLGKLMPDAFLGIRGFRPFVRWRFAPVSPEAERLLVEMARASSANQIRAFGHMVVQWEGLDPIPCPVLAIHGERDRIIPLRCAEPGLTLQSAGHAFTLTHAEAVSRAIDAFLTRVNSAPR